MARRRSFFFNLLSTWADHGIGLVVSLILMPIVLRAVGDTTYGVWVFLNSIAGYSGLLYLGMGTTVSRYVADSQARGSTERLNRVVSVALTVYSFMGVIGLCVAGGAAAGAAWMCPAGIELESFRLVLLVLGLNVALGLLGSVFGGILGGVERFDYECVISVLAGIVRIALTLALVHADGGLLKLSLITLAVTLIENGAYFVIARRVVPELRLRIGRFDRETLRECMGFSGFAFVHQIAGQLIYMTDTIVIGMVLGAKAIVPYHVALRLCHFIRKPIGNIGMVALPRAGQLNALSQTDQLWNLVVRGAGLAFALASGVTIGAAFFGEAVITTWVGAEYSGSFPILMILLATQVIATPMGVLRSVLFGLGEAKFPAMLYLVQAVCNLALSITLVHHYGPLGVALGTAIPVILIEACWFCPIAVRRLSGSCRQLFRAVVGPQMLALYAIWSYSALVNHYFPNVRGWPALFVVTTGGGIVIGGMLMLDVYKQRRLAPARS